MNWESILTEVVLSVLGVAFTALSALVTYWISKKIKDERLQSILSSLNDIVGKAVLEVYQTYVEELKDGGLFDEEKQKIALSRALAIIEGNLSEEVETWLKSSVKDYETYLKTMIEAKIASLKR